MRDKLARDAAAGYSGLVMATRASDGRCRCAHKEIMSIYIEKSIGKYSNLITFLT